LFRVAASVPDVFAAIESGAAPSGDPKWFDTR
jgi:hypothetical protein